MKLIGETYLKHKARDMIPSLFSTQEEIVKKLKNVARVHSFDNVKVLSHIFYDVIKMAYYALKRKKTGLKRAPLYPVNLGRQEVARLTRLVHYHHSNDKEFTVAKELIQCFDNGFSESDACYFFEKFIEGDVKDKFGREIYIDLENGLKFMYKNYATGKHAVSSEFYLPYRGKRLPWIKHTFKNTSNIYGRIINNDLELMHIAKYNMPFLIEGEKCKCFWAVISKKYQKDIVGPYKFKTAFPIFKYNNLLSRLERYEPIIYLK